MVQMALIQIVGPQPGQIYPLKKERIVIGRGRQCDIILDAVSISRMHCILTFREDFLYLEDGGSSGGIYVNDHLVHEVALVPGDKIKIGSTYLKVLGPARCEGAFLLDPSKEAYLRRHLCFRIDQFVRELIEQGQSFGLIRVRFSTLAPNGGAHRAIEGVWAAVRRGVEGFEVEMGALASFELAVLVRVGEPDLFGALCERIEEAIAGLELPREAWGLGFSMGRWMDAPSDLLTRAEPND